MPDFAKTLHIQYYAVLREQRGLSQEQYVTESANPGELYQELSKRFSLSVHPQLLRLAINDQFAAWDSPLQDGDKIIFMPPVAGG